MADDKGDEDEVMAIANRVVDITHRADLLIGSNNWMTVASGPRITDSGDGVTERIVTVNFIYEL